MLLLIPMLGLALTGLAWRRRRRRRRATADLRSPSSRQCGRCMSMLIVIGIVAISSTVGTPAFADGIDLCGSKTAPEPEWPGTGLIGSIDLPTASSGLMNSIYREYSYAGLDWNTYDLGCAPAGLASPGSGLDTWLGNQEFNVAKLGVAVTNWAHYEIAYGEHSLFTPLDDLVRDGVNTMWNSVFVRWVGIALVVLSVMLLFWSGTGDLPKQTRHIALAVVALAAAGASYLAPVSWSSTVDSFLFESTADLQNGFLPQADPVNQLPTLLVDRVVWDNWKRGEFGAVDGVDDATARDLLSTQAHSKDEAANDPNPYDSKLKKQEHFKEIASSLEKTRFYQYFQGKKGSRTGIGALAILQSACLGFFQLASNLVMMLALIIVRLMIVALPAIAVVAVVRPSILFGVLRIVGSAIFNAMFLSLLSGLHAMILFKIFDPTAMGADFVLATVISLIISLLMWAVARPVKRMVAMTRTATEQIGLGAYDPSSRMSRQLRRQYRRLNRRAGRGGEADERWWNVDGDRAPATERPEQNAGTTTVRATISRDEDSRTARPHGSGDPGLVGRGPTALPAGSGVTRVPSSGRPWAQARPEPKQLTGTTGRRALPAGTTTSTTTTASAPNNGRGGGDPSAAPITRARPAGTTTDTGNGSPAAGPGTPPATSQPTAGAGEPPRAPRALPSRERSTSSELWDTDTQSVVIERDAGPNPRAADVRTDADGTPVYVVMWDSKSQSFQRDQLPPASPAADEDGQ